MLESMSIQIFPTYCFCCTILLIIKINQLCSPLLVSISSVRQLTRHSNWIKVTSNWPLGIHNVRFQWKISTFCSKISCFLSKILLKKNLRGAKIKPFSSVISIFFHLDFGLKFKNWHFKTPFVSASNSYFTH